MTEYWKKIKGYEDSYEVSNLGRIKSLIRNPEIILKPNKVRGYLQVGLFNGNSVQKKCLVHRLVAEAFLINPHRKPHVNHKDGNKANNLIDNLEWVTGQENMLHAYDSGLVKNGLGGASGFSTLNEN
jgi:hypothetical protein